MKWAPLAVFLAALAISGVAGIAAVNWLIGRSYDKQQEQPGE